MSERRQPDDIARVELETEGGGVGFADNARVFHIGSVNHTYRTGGQEVARYERDGGARANPETLPHNAASKRLRTVPANCCACSSEVSSVTRKPRQ